MTPLSTSEIRELLKRLDGSPADAIESETLECTSWDSAPQAFDSNVRHLRETVVGLANSHGGTVILGIRDRKQTRKDAIQGVGDLSAQLLQKKVYDGTEPHILVNIEELVEPEGRLLLVHVPRGMPPHTTSEGVAKIRIGKETKPLTGSQLSLVIFGGGQKDLTAQIIPDSSIEDLDPEEIKRLRRIIETEGTNPDLAKLPDTQLLSNLEIVREGKLTLAAVLLLGKATTLSRWAPQHELIFARFKTTTRPDVRKNLKGPILAVLDAAEQILQMQGRQTIALASGFSELALPDIHPWVIRESILNALVHRDYFLSQSIHVHLYDNKLEVSSPGGFVGGVSPDNILRHPPRRRNPLLADALEKAGLVNRLGMGVDRIYEEILKIGKRMPVYDANESFVRLMIPTATNTEFARFVAEEIRADRKLELDDLICLRTIGLRGHLDRWHAAKELQLSEDQAAERLASLRSRGYLVPHGRGRSTSYRLARALSDKIRGQEATDFDLPLDDEAVRLRVQTVLQERGKLTNAEVRRISGYNRVEAVRLMHKLIAEGYAALKGRGRGAHYIAGKKRRPK